MKNTIFNIQKFCIKDGPGIRTTVFLKGCNLNCVWCHNPESKSAKPVLMFNKDKCRLCGECARVCSNHQIGGEHLIDRKTCVACGKCVQVCSGALSICGEEKTAEEIIAEVLKDSAFYKNSGGGLTLSGGEPLYNIAFTKEILQLAKQNELHTCLETCGFSSWENIQSILDFVDIFLWDLKETDPKLHKEYTGVSNELILENLNKLNNAGAKIILRCPIIPGYNDRQEHFLNIANIANQLDNIMQVEIMPYHPLGKGKSQEIGEKYLLDQVTFPTKEQVKKWVKSISNKTNKKVLSN